MEITISFEKVQIVAWWGAILSSIVFLWDIYKWKTSGPRVVIRVNPNMIFYGYGSIEHEGKTYIHVRATNIGNRQTTITNLGFRYYSKWLFKFIKKPEKSAVVGNPGITYPLPYVLQPGTEWSGIMLQNAEIEEMAKNGIIICELYIADKEKPIASRIKIQITQN